MPALTLLGVLGAAIERGDDHLEALRTVRPGFDLEAERRARAAAGVSDEPRAEDLYPDALRCLTATAAAGYRVGAVGNTSVEMERFLREHCGLDVVASSARLGVAKPHPAFFAAVARLMDVPPERIAYVGDRLDNDVLPAKTAGMVAVHVRRGPWGYLHALRPEAARADLRIDSLDELLPGLAALGRPSGGSRLDDEGFVQRQYRSTERLSTRMSVWRPGPDGVTAQDVAVAALAAVRPARLLEVGCGTGAFAERCARDLGCEVVALDASPEMVRTTSARGIDARVGDVRALPFADGTFDAAVAAWMLYHVGEVDLAIAELARVLRPGGRLVAITNGDGALRELYEAVGGARRPSTFSAENGADQLARRFARVERRDVEAWADFPDRAAAAAYLESLDRGELADRLPDGPWPLVVRGAPAVFVADTAGGG